MLADYIFMRTTQDGVADGTARWVVGSVVRRDEARGGRRAVGEAVS